MTTITSELGSHAEIGAPRRLDEICQSGTLTTWRMRSETSHTQRTRVDWPLLLEGGYPTPMARAPHGGPTSTTACVGGILHAFQELGHYRDLDALLRRAVDGLKSVVGIERAAVLLLTGSGNTLRGTWGSDARGTTINETHIEFELGKAHREAFARAKAGVGHWLVLDNVPLLAQEAHKTIIVAHGWNAMLPILGVSGTPMGLIVCDSALTHSPADDSRLTSTAVFAALLGAQLERFGTEVATVAGEAPELSARAIRVMRDNPCISRGELARRLGVSAGVLGKRFKAEMDETLLDYTNRLRLERFLKLVDPSGGNLLASALDAGFGSYAQFHRVFRRVLGCSPKTYLDRNPRRE